MSFATSVTSSSLRAWRMRTAVSGSVVTPLQLVEPRHLLGAGVGHEERGEEAPEDGVVAPPAHPDEARS